MCLDPGETVLFQNDVTDWKSSLIWDRFLPKERSRPSPLFIVREFIREMKQKIAPE